jgi:succinate dehydrogenase hydrophobic anchor subunit
MMVRKHLRNFLGLYVLTLPYPLLVTLSMVESSSWEIDKYWDALFFFGKALFYLVGLQPVAVVWLSWLVIAEIHHVRLEQRASVQPVRKSWFKDFSLNRITALFVGGGLTIAWILTDQRSSQPWTIFLFVYFFSIFSIHALSSRLWRAVKSKWISGRQKIPNV